MSVDNRVVKLQFDNKQFEENVSKSMATLDKLEEQLQFKKAAKGFSSLQSSVDSIKFDALLSSIDRINDKLSAGGVLAAKLVSGITDSIVTGVKKIEAASIGQMKTGGWNRAMNIENAKFAVEGLKGDWDQLYQAMDYAVTGTAYGIDQAAKAASTLMASSVDYTKTIEKNGNTNITQMHKALRAISGVAAQTNSQFDDIAHIFTTVAGNGRLMADQLNQLSGRGMNAAAILGEQLGMTEAQIREATSKGQIDFNTFANAMDKAFGEHATDANKTFTGSLSNMKAALSRFGAVFATPIIQKTNTFFISLTNVIKKMKNAISDVTENGKVLEEHLEGHFAKMWENLIALGSALVENIDLEWFTEAADAADRLVEKLSGIFEVMATYAKELGSKKGSVAKTIWNLATITKEEKEVAEMVIRGAFGNGAKRKAELEEYIKKNELNMNAEKIQEYVNVVSKYGYSFDKAKIKIGEFTEEDKEAADEQKEIIRIFQNVRDIIDDVTGSIDNIKDAVGDFGEVLATSFGGVTGILSDVTSIVKTFTDNVHYLTLSLKPGTDVLIGFYSITEVLADSFKKVKSATEGAIKWVANFTVEIVNGWKRTGILRETLENMAVTIANVSRIVGNIATTIGRVIKAIATAFFKVFNPAKATRMLGNFSSGLADLSDHFVLSEEGAEVLTDVLTDIFTVVDKIIDKVGIVVEIFAALIGSFKKTKTNGEDASEVVEDVGDQVTATGDKFAKLIEIGSKIKDFFEELGRNFKELMNELKESEGIKALRDSLAVLGGSLEDSVSSGFASFKNGLEEINKEAGTSITVKDVADAIGKFAGKVAEIINKLPSAVTTIKEFFSSIYQKAKEFFGKMKETSDKFGIKDIFSGIIEFGKAALTDIEGTFNTIISGIKKALDTVNWGDILESGFVVSAIYFLYKVATLADSIKTMLTSVTGIFTVIKKTFSGFSKFIATFGKSMELISKAIFLGTLAASILAIAAALIIISKIPEGKLEQALAVVVIIAIVLKVLMSALQKLFFASAAKTLQKNQTGTVKLLATSVVKVMMIGGLIYAIAKSVDLILKGIDTLVEMTDKYNSDQIMAAMMGIGLILLALLAVTTVFAFVTSILTKRMTRGVVEAYESGIMITAFALAFALIGVALLAVATAAEKVAALGQAGEDAISAVIKVMIFMALAIGVIMLTVKGVQGADLVIVAVIMLELIIGLAVVFAGIYLLASLISMNKLLTKDSKSTFDPITQATLLVVLVMLMLALSVSVMADSIKNVSTSARKTKASGKLMTTIMGGLMLMIGGALATVIVLSLAVKDMDADQCKALMMSMTMVAAVILSIGSMFDHLSGLIKNFANVDQLKEGSKLILAAGASVFLMIAGLALVAVVIGAYDIDPGELAVMMGGLVLMLVALSIGFNQIAKAASKGIDPKTMTSLGVVMLMLAGAILVISIAIAVLSKSMIGLDPSALIAIGVGITVILAFIVIVLNQLTSHMYSMKGVTFDDNDVKMLQNLGLVIIGLAAAALIIAGAAALLTAANVSPLTVIGLIGVMAAIGLLVFGLSALFGMDNKVGKAASSGLTTVANALKAISLAFLIFGAAILVAGIGLHVLNPALEGFASAFIGFAEAIEAHSATAIGIGILIVAILLVVGITIFKTMPVIDKIVTAVTNALNIIWDIIKKVGGAIAKGIGNFHKNEKLSNGVKMTIVTMIVALASALTESGPQVLQKIGMFINMVLDWLAAAIPGIVEKLLVFLLELIFGLTDAIFRHINEISAAIMGLLSALAAVVVTLLRDIISTIVTGLFGDKLGRKAADAIGKTFTSMADNFRHNAEKLRAEAKEMDAAIAAGGDARDVWSLNHPGSVDDDWKDDAEAYLEEGEAQTEAMQALNDKQKKNEEDAQKAMNSFVRAKQLDLNKVVVVAKKANDTIAAQRQAMVSAGEAFEVGGNFYKLDYSDRSRLDWDPEYLDQFDYYLFKAAQNIDEGTEKIEESGAKAEKTSDNVINQLKTTLMAKFGGDTGKVNAFMSSIPADMLNNNSYDVGELMAMGSIDGYTDTMSTDGAASMVDVNSLVGADAAASFDDAYSAGLVADSDQFEQAADNTVDATVEYMTDSENRKKMLEGGSKLSAKGAAGVRQEIWMWQDSTERCIDGMRRTFDKFINGSVSDPRSLPAIMSQLSNAMQNEFCGPRNMDINSPSKTMMKIGGYIVDGLANGIYGETTEAINAMSDLSTTMTSAFSYPLDYVSKVASGEYEYDPSIRPVLDTSLVSRGAYGINSLFNDQNVTLHGLSGSIAADIGQLDGSNMEIIAELKALRSDMTEMGDKIAGMQVVMDSGRLVGAIAPDMDRALGSRVSSSYRGKG